LAIWIYLFLARGNFWQLREDDIYLQPLANWPRVTAIVPARNEAENIAKTVHSPRCARVSRRILDHHRDDHSEDGTAALAQKAASESALRNA